MNTQGYPTQLEGDVPVPRMMVTLF